MHKREREERKGYLVRVYCMYFARTTYVGTFVLKRIREGGRLRRSAKEPPPPTQYTVRPERREASIANGKLVF